MSAAERSLVFERPHPRDSVLCLSPNLLAAQADMTKARPERPGFG